MSEQTIQAIQAAVLAHVQDQSCEHHQNVVLSDFIVCYDGMAADAESPNGIANFGGYVTGPESTPATGVGMLVLALDEIKHEILHGCPAVDGPS